MKRRLLSLTARACVVGGIMLVVAGLYPPAWADADDASLLLVGLLAAYVLVSVKSRRP